MSGYMLDHATTISNSPGFALVCGCNTWLVHGLFFFFLSSGWEIVRNFSQQYILVALKGNDTIFCNGWWRGNCEPKTFCIHWKKFCDQLLDFAFSHTAIFGQKNNVGLCSCDLALCDFSCRETKYVQRISYIFLQDFERCDERP